MNSCLLVEDHAPSRASLARIVSETFPGVTVHEAEDLGSALGFLDRGEPIDLALVDLGLPDGSGLEALRRLGSTRPEVRAIVLTVIHDDATIVAALSAGAFGYLLKEQDEGQLRHQLLQIESGVPPLSPSIAARLIEHFKLTGPTDRSDEPLTGREREVLRRIARGQRNREVADALGVAESTVASHIKSIYRKLGISTRAEASWHATRLGL